MSQSQITKPAETLEELLSYNDEHFIHSAYITLLGRVPDPEGMNYYLARARDGINKVEILSQLRHSAEGKSRQLKITGLNEAIRRHKQLRTPLLGSLLRFAGLKQVEGATKNNVHKYENQPRQNLVNLFERHGINEAHLPQNLTVETINRLNPHEDFKDIYQAFSALLEHTPIRKLRVYDKDKLNADFYLKIADNHNAAGRSNEAIEFYRLSILFANTPNAHEALGNISLGNNRLYQAIEHYKTALDLKSNSAWVYANLAKAQALCGQTEMALDTISTGINNHKSSAILISIIDELVEKYWNIEEQKLDCIAVTQNREKLIIEYEKVITRIGDFYANYFTRNSEIPVTAHINGSRVLIIGITQEAAPQCFRYRMDQKKEQLIYAGYEVEMIAWHENALALKNINLYDVIIFYRVPAFPGVLKLIEYAKSLGKITFFEVDDLLFEPTSVPDIETYGGQVSMASYTNVTKDIGSYRAAAMRCDYAIASTLPLLEKLVPLVKTKIGYLHRNGFDRHNQLIQQNPVDKGYVNIFYGSGTLAHNSDFIIEALPAISKILREYREVKLTIVGYLTLPLGFLREFKGRVIQVPLVKDISAYWSYLSASNINLAVLHDDSLTACKSELKWFEAAAFSIPSVVSRTQNYLDVIKQEEDGFVVSGEREWYEALKKLIESPELRKNIGNNAFERVKEEYSVKTLAKNIDKIIKNTISYHIIAVNKNKSVINSVTTK